MHLNQLRKAKIISFVNDEAKVYTNRSLSRLHDTLAKAEHFMFTALPVADEEIQASAAAMKAAGVWRLPYPVTTFEFNGFFRPTEEKSARGYTLRKVEEDPSHVIIFVATEQAVDGEGVIKDMSEVGYVRWIFARQPFNKTEWADMGSELAHDEVQRIFSGLMVALRTKGIRRERWSSDHKLSLDRKEPENAYTRVMIRETLASGQGTIVVGDRHRVRLHLRRGHERQQPYGKGRQLIRSVWIDPMLVGYADDGVIEHEAYMV